MRITESRLRRVIREELLREARMTASTLPDDVRLELEVAKSRRSIYLFAYQGENVVGELFSVKTKKNCFGAYEVMFVAVQIDGLGPLMYDIVMEMATALSADPERGGLISDRKSVTPEALQVWKKYRDIRKHDVKRLQLDSLEDERTPGYDDDNCDATLAKAAAGEDWADHPLSGAYRKSGLETIRELEDSGQLIVKELMKL